MLALWRGTQASGWGVSDGVYFGGPDGILKRLFRRLPWHSLEWPDYQHTQQTRLPNKITTPNCMIFIVIIKETLRN